MRSSSAVALAVDAKGTARRVVAYVADPDDGALHVVDVGEGKALSRTKLAGTPEQVLVLADGRVAVTLRHEAEVQVLEPVAVDQPLESLCRVPAPTEPIGLAETPDGKQVLVSSGWGRALSLYASSSFALTRTVPLPREPRTIVVSEDGKKALVSHVVEAKMSIVDLEADAAPRVIDLQMKQTLQASGRRNNNLRGGCQGYSLVSSVEMPVDESTPRIPSIERPNIVGQPARPVPVGPRPGPAPKPKNARVFAPFVAVEPGDTTVPSAGYGASTAFGLPAEVSAVTVIDPIAERNITRALTIEPANRENARKGDCILPRAAAYSNGALYVACMGNDALVELDGRSVDPARNELRRWAVPSGPTGVAIDSLHALAVVWSQFDHKLSIVPLSGGASRAVSLAPSTPLDPALARGRVLFHQTFNPGVSSDGRTCASCHPDGREDALTWSTPEGPRQTIMLAGRLKDSGPFSWSGMHPSVEDHLKHTMSRLGGKGLSAADTHALITYVNALPTPKPTALPVSEQRKKLIEQGREVFYSTEAACGTCHVGGGTDARGHDVGSRAPGDRTGVFETPSLKHLAVSAPYFHDGRFATLESMLFGSNGTMGHTNHLSREQRLALLAYLETL